MPHMPQQPHDFPSDILKELTDKAKTIALARGVDEPDWGDAWKAVIHFPAFSTILRDRGINTTTLNTEIDFIAYFRPPTYFDLFNVFFKEKDPDPHEVASAARQLAYEISDLEVLRDHDKNETLSGAMELLALHVQKILESIPDTVLFESDLKSRFLNTNGLDENTVKAIRDARLRYKLLDLSIKKAADQAFRTINVINDNHDAGEDPEFNDVMKKILSQVRKTLYFEANDILQDDAKNDTPLAVLRDLKSSSLLGPSPLDIVTHMMQGSEPGYITLMYRAGMRAKADQHITDELADDLPSSDIQSLLIAARQLAHSRSDKTVTPSHVVMVLLQDSKIVTHLRKMGVTDMMTFRDGLAEKLFPEDSATKKSMIRAHVEIPQEMMELDGNLEDIYAKDNRLPDILRHFIQNYPDITACFAQMEFGPEKMETWDSFYKSKEDAVVEKKKTSDFKISERDLEDVIETYCSDLTARANDKKFDPLIGHEAAMEQIETILLKRGRKNPALIGEPGIGKSKLLEGLALRIASGQTHEDLIGARLISLDLHQMNDMPYVGIFEGRILTLLKGIAERNARKDGPPILLCIDEYAEAQKAGGHAHSPGFAGMIKTHITNGDIVMISTMTEAEYRNKVETDGAIARRLQTVPIHEPTLQETRHILAGLKSHYATHHKLDITDDAIELAVRLTDQYIPSLRQPDKTIDVLDEACAIARKSGHASLQSASLLKAVSSRTNIPEHFLSGDDNQRYAMIEESLAQRVLAQDEAITEIAAALQMAKAGLRDPRKPIGNFLFVGPTGVGKTETAKALAEFLFGNERDFLVRFDMSDYQEKHAASRFVGAPPGYVGYDEGSVLIKSLRSKPAGVYLYDECDKAHSDVFTTLLAPFDDGKMKDARGMEGDMRQVINIMTGNYGAHAVIEHGKREGLDPLKDYDAWQEMAAPIYMSDVERSLRPEFRNRLDAIVCFKSLHPDTLYKLIDRHKAATISRVQEKYGIGIDLSDTFEAAARAVSLDILFGARPLGRVWNKVVNLPLSNWLLRQPVSELKRGREIVATIKADKPEFILR